MRQTLKISQKCRRLNDDKPKVAELIRAELRWERMYFDANLNSKHRSKFLQCSHLRSKG